jgi:hypothetical protein
LSKARWRRINSRALCFAKLSLLSAALPIVRLRIQATMSKSNAINPTKFYGLKACRTPRSQHGTVIAKTLLALTQYAKEILNAFNGDGNVDWVVMWVIRHSLQLIIKSEKGGNTYQLGPWSSLDCARLQWAWSCEIHSPRLRWKAGPIGIFERWLHSKL